MRVSLLGWQFQKLLVEALDGVVRNCERRGYNNPAGVVHKLTVLALIAQLRQRGVSGASLHASHFHVLAQDRQSKAVELRCPVAVLGVVQHHLGKEGKHLFIGKAGFEFFDKDFEGGYLTGRF